ncbi:MAG: molybdenum cofactor guanylyltransferase MobA [Magnetospirillum sp.]|nr:molybdenum cofactor guanylyltransferase MobA [Magnetospirillum sp.]
MPPSPSPSPIAGMILAGGLARRMGGGDKALMEVKGKTLLDHTLARLARQVSPILLNANGDPARFARFGLEVRADVIDGYGGPLVGILTGLEWAAGLGADRLVTTAADTPLFPTDLAARLDAAVQAKGADIAMAVSAGRSHPVFALWPVSLTAELRRAVAEQGERKVEAFADRYTVARVEWPAIPLDPFFNANTPDELARLADLLD